MKKEVVYLLYKYTDYEEISIFGIFTREEIKKYRRKIRNSDCLLVLLDVFVEHGVKL